LLDGLTRDADISELVGELAPLHPRDNTFPGEVILGLAAASSSSVDDTNTRSRWPGVLISDQPP
jgi:hypothetical protein